jgi:uncharacterized membrane protein
VTKPVLSRARHLAKAISYRILGTIATIAIGWSVTGSVEVGASLGIIDIVVKTLIYYIHERIWYRIPFGVTRDDSLHTASRTVDRSDRPI